MSKDEYKRESFDKEWEKMKLLKDKDILMLIFRELWDIRQANISVSRTLESENV